MKDRAEIAKELFKNGHNCSQSIFTAFADIYCINKEKMLELITPFSNNSAGKQVICEAVSAMTMIAELEDGSSIPYEKNDGIGKHNKVDYLMEQFKTKYGSILCKRLIGLEQCASSSRKITDCSECVHFCAKLIDEAFFKK